MDRDEALKLLRTVEDGVAEWNTRSEDEEIPKLRRTARNTTRIRRATIRWDHREGRAECTGAVFGGAARPTSAVRRSATRASQVPGATPWASVWPQFCPIGFPTVALGAARNDNGGRLPVLI